MSPGKIKSLIKEKNTTQLAIAKTLGTSHVCVHDVIYGKRQNPLIKALIAQIIGLPIEHVWDNPPKRPITEYDFVCFASKKTGIDMQL